MPAATPRRSGRQAKPGARFMADVLADNVRAYRLVRRLEQTEVAAGLARLGHSTWTRATVSQVERGQRNVTVDELLALGLVLEAAPFDLLNPVPIGGGRPQDAPALDVGTATPLEAGYVWDWLRGVVRAKVAERADGSTFVLGWVGGLSPESVAEQERIAEERETKR